MAEHLVERRADYLAVLRAAKKAGLTADQRVASMAANLVASSVVPTV